MLLLVIKSDKFSAKEANASVEVSLHWVQEHLRVSGDDRLSGFPPEKKKKTF